MSFADGYLTKQSPFNATFLKERPCSTLGMAVVIPCYNEPWILKTLEGLLRCKPTLSHVEVLVIINSAENSPKDHIKRNRETMQLIQEWTLFNRSPHMITYPLLFENLPVKDAGVGLARKLGMDEAVKRFNVLNKPAGVIISLDADCICEANYLIEIENRFKAHPRLNGANINVEHPFETKKMNDSVNHAIVLYELYLRYYVQALRNIGYPYAIHTIGSGFAVRAGAYVKQGGMNKRKAGEDFYFLQKLAALGNFGEINSTQVIPSSRMSERVPFGTGPQIKKIIENHLCIETFTLEAYHELENLFSSLETLYQAKGNDAITCTPSSRALGNYLVQQCWGKKLQEIKRNTSTFQSFRKRFYQWFNPFMVFKFLNFAHRNYYEKQNILNVLNETYPDKKNYGAAEWLLYLRAVQKMEAYFIPQ